MCVISVTVCEIVTYEFPKVCHSNVWSWKWSLRILTIWGKITGEGIWSTFIFMQKIVASWSSYLFAVHTSTFRDRRANVWTNERTNIRPDGNTVPTPFERWNNVCLWWKTKSWSRGLYPGSWIIPGLVDYTRPRGLYPASFIRLYVDFYYLYLRPNDRPGSHSLSVWIVRFETLNWNMRDTWKLINLPRFTFFNTCYLK